MLYFHGACFSSWSTNRFLAFVGWHGAPFEGRMPILEELYAPETFPCFVERKPAMESKAHHVSHHIKYPNTSKCPLLTLLYTCSSLLHSPSPTAQEFCVRRNLTDASCWEPRPSCSVLEHRLFPGDALQRQKKRSHHHSSYNTPSWCTCSMGLHLGKGWPHYNTSPSFILQNHGLGTVGCI